MIHVTIIYVHGINTIDDLVCLIVLKVKATISIDKSTLSEDCDYGLFRSQCSVHESNSFSTLTLPQSDKKL